MKRDIETTAKIVNDYPYNMDTLKLQLDLEDIATKYRNYIRSLGIEPQTITIRVVFPDVSCILNMPIKWELAPKKSKLCHK